MKADSRQWHQMGPSASSEEQRGLDLLRALLPDAPSTWVWANLTFNDGSGRLAEVDAILLNHNGLFVVELKGWHGQITGNPQFWTVTGPNGRRREERNPLLSCHGKAQRLATLLKQTATKNKISVEIPFIQGITVLHGDGAKVSLEAVAREHTYALDGVEVTGLPLLSTLTNEQFTRIDKGRARQIAQVLAKAGFVETPRQRMAGHYAIDLGSPLAEGDTWVDVEAEHPGIPGERRRIRLYDVPSGVSQQQREEIFNNARREYQFTTGLGHPSVVTALEFLSTDSGPALVFPADVNSTPLESWLDANRDVASLDSRLVLLRQIAEVVRYAHDHRVQHRALSPSKIRVVQKGDEQPRVTIRDWQSGRKQRGSSTTTRWPTALLTSTLRIDLNDEPGLLYMAPEANTEFADAVALDIYSLGSLAHLLIAQTAPALNVPALRLRIEAGGLDPSADLDGLTEGLIRLVRHATTPKVLDRTPTVDAFIAELEEAERELREESQRGDPEAIVDPLDAQESDIVGDWLVEERIGIGSTGLALLVSDGEVGSTGFVLKVALDEEKGEGLAREGAVLASLEHPRVVRLVEGPMMVSNRTCLLLEDAGRPTLAQRLRDGGRLTLEQLEKFSADLFEAAAYLERAGVFHRDIKPENLGVRPNPGDRRPRLVLFDFSHSSQPLDAIRSGTAPYLDPFLGPPKRPRYDSAAERFAIAATLFEMATGRLPEWGDGMSSPAAIDDEVTAQPGMFDAAVGEQLSAFFSRALARDVKDRFGDLAEMADAWHQVFRSVTVPADEIERDQESRNIAAHTAGITTPIELAGLTPRAVSALHRLDAGTVGEVMALPAMQINQVAGLGVEVRREIQARRGEWLKRLHGDTASEEDLAPHGRAIEDILKRIVPSPNGRNSNSVTLAKALVASADGAVGGSLWPAWTELVAAAGLSGWDSVEALRSAWSRSDAVKELREEVVEILVSLEGMGTLEEVSSALVSRHGSVAQGNGRLARASILVRAAAEIPSEGMSLNVNRGRTDDVPILLALGESDAHDCAQQLSAVRVLAAVVDEAVAERPMVHGSAESLRRVADDGAAQTPYLPLAQRLLSVSVAASHMAALSARGELYPKGLSPQESVRAVLAGGIRFISIEGLNRRVAERFRHAAPLPPRPALDALVSSTAPSLQWRDNAYSRASESASILRTATRLTGAVQIVELDHDNVPHKLASSLTARSGLVLAALPKSLDQAAITLADRFDVSIMNVTERLIAAMHSTAARGNVDWSVVVRADAQPLNSRDRQQLERLVDASLQTFWPELMNDPRPLLLTDLAPLARYGQMSLLSPITDLTVARPAARWLLIPRRPTDGAPVLEGQPVPLAADGWLDLPSSLLNLSNPRSGVAG